MFHAEDFAIRALLFFKKKILRLTTSFSVDKQKGTPRHPIRTLVIKLLIIKGLDLSSGLERFWLKNI